MREEGRSGLRIQWLPPLDRLFGATSELSLDESTPVSQVLTRLSASVPDFAPYGRFGARDRQPQGLLVLRRGNVLTLEDRVRPGDEIEMLMMIAGG